MQLTGVRGLSPRKQTPHPALRATFSRKGRRKESEPQERNASSYAFEYFFSSNRAIWFLCTSSGPSASRSKRAVA
ncbi:hypothetical protein ACVWXM_009326 [Bradyrhizobium sp. GM7.3]